QGHDFSARFLLPIGGSHAAPNAASRGRRGCLPTQPGRFIRRQCIVDQTDKQQLERVSRWLRIGRVRRSGHPLKQLFAWLSVAPQTKQPIEAVHRGVDEGLPDGLATLSPELSEIANAFVK